MNHIATRVALHVRPAAARRGAAIGRYARSHGYRSVAIRLNGTSDVPWDLVRVLVDRHALPLTQVVRHRIQAAAAGVVERVSTYDCTKAAGRAQLSAEGRSADPGHLLTNSHSEESRPAAVDRILQAGGRVSVVFDSYPIPRSWPGHPVVDATEHDVRAADPPGFAAHGSPRRIRTAVPGTKTRDDGPLHQGAVRWSTRRPAMNPPVRSPVQWRASVSSRRAHRRSMRDADTGIRTRVAGSRGLHDGPLHHIGGGLPTCHPYFNGSGWPRCVRVSRRAPHGCVHVHFQLLLNVRQARSTSPRPFTSR